MMMLTNGLKMRRWPSASLKDEEGLLDVKVVQAMVTLQRGDFPRAADQAHAIIDQTRPYNHLHGRALNVFRHSAYMNMGDVKEGLPFIEQALPVYEADGDAFAISGILQSLEIAYRRVGRLDDAAACLQRVVALRRELGSTGALALALNNLGFHYHQHSNYQEALTTFQEGLSLVTRVPNQRTESYLLWSMADLQRDRGAFSESLDLYNRALELTGKSEPELRASILISMANLHRWQNNIRQADQYATDASALADQHKLRPLPSCSPRRQSGALGQ